MNTDFNYLQVVIVTCKHSMKWLCNSDCNIRDYFPTARKSVANEGIQGKSISIVTFTPITFSTAGCIAIVTSQLCM